MTEIEFLIIDKENSGRRLDNFLFSKYRKVPKSKIYSSIRKAKIKVNDKKSKPDYKLLSNDKRTVETNIELRWHWPENYFQIVINLTSIGFGATICMSKSNGCC